jgi:hypothetical protein
LVGLLTFEIPPIWEVIEVGKVTWPKTIPDTSPFLCMCSCLRAIEAWEKQIKLIGLYKHTQQRGSSQPVDTAARMVFAVIGWALREL